MRWLSTMLALLCGLALVSMGCSSNEGYSGPERRGKVSRDQPQKAMPEKLGKISPDEPVKVFREERQMKNEREGKYRDE